MGQILSTDLRHLSFRRNQILGQMMSRRLALNRRPQQRLQLLTVCAAAQRLAQIDLLVREETRA